MFKFQYENIDHTTVWKPYFPQNFVEHVVE